jgi:CheY-like chemotaxis protein
MRVKKLCIIDDDDLYKLLLKKSVKNLGNNVEILTYSNGEEAFIELSKLKNSPDLLPDLILLDINMPVMNGWELLDELNLRNIPLGRIYVIMVTSSVDPLDRLKATEYQHIIGFLEKPLTTQSIHTIRNIPQIKLLL